MNKPFKIIPSDSFIIIPKDKKVTLINEVKANIYHYEMDKDEKNSDTTLAIDVDKNYIAINQDENNILLSYQNFEKVINIYNKIKEYKGNKNR